MPAEKMQDRYFIINKPRGMISQFISSHNKKLLGDLDFSFPEATHSIGRLDEDSEGLLLLTTDKKVTRLLFLDKEPHKRQYLVMVQKEMSEKSVEHLRAGIIITIKKGENYKAVPSAVEVVESPHLLYNFAEDDRMAYPHTWLLITLTEGKHRQVRKMMMAAKHRCLRLVRLNISDMLLGDIAPGAVVELEKETFYKRLRIN